MTEKSAVSGRFRFSVDSSLLFQLGEQLVAKPSVALAELVKNAYDADATQVVIRLENVGQKGGTIVVTDNGHGMTFEEIESNWMRIATTIKADNRVSRVFKRALTGAKGVGRFAARRLGNRLTISSIAELKDGSKEQVVARFNWEKQFLPGEDLVHVAVHYRRRVVPQQCNTGVTLVISDARDSWTKEEIMLLRRDLLGLQSPFPDLVLKPESVGTNGIQVDPGFNIEMDIEGAEELERLSGGLGDAFLNAAWARLDGRIDLEGKAHYDIEVLHSRELDQLYDDTNSYAGLELARFRIFFFVYRSEYFRDSEFGVRDASQRGREEGGVRIYLDGFRVFPYGSAADDWLRLDEYAVRNIDMAARDIVPTERVMSLAGELPGRPYLLIPRNRQLFGAVSLSQTQHAGVEVNISRERLIETATVARLREFVQNGVYWMTLKYAAFSAEEKSKRQREQPRKSVSDIMENVKEAIAQQATIPGDRLQYIIFGLDEAIQQAKEEEEDRISEISMLRILASAGTTITIMNHQLQALIGAVLQTKEDMARLRPEIPDYLLSQFDDIIAQVTEWYELVYRQVSQLGYLLSADSRQRRKRQPLRTVVDNVMKPMLYYMNNYGVSFENNVSNSTRTPPIYESELYAVMINVLSNSLKAVYNQPLRQVAVEASKSDGNLRVYMKDTGVGLPPERWEQSFRPFVTTSIPNPILGTGTGLGLKVVRDILQLYGGTARFVDVEPPWRTCIELILPERSERRDD